MTHWPSLAVSAASAVSIIRHLLLMILASLAALFGAVSATGAALMDAAAARRRHASPIGRMAPALAAAPSVSRRARHADVPASTSDARRQAVGARLAAARTPATAMPMAALVAAALLMAASPARAGEAEAAALFERIRDQPPRLRIFLQAMPKGGDLHNHLWGVPYAEEFLAWAAEDGLCISPSPGAITAPPCTAPASVPAKDLATRDPALYSAMIDALSVRGHEAGVGADEVSGHDQFFATFDRFAPVAVRSAARMVASARRKASYDHVSYLELIHDPAAFARVSALAARLPLAREADIARAWATLAPQLEALVADASAETDKVDADVQHALGCDAEPDSAPCRVEVRYLGFALRESPAPVVFGQLALAFALADRDPRFVGVNIVQPEDGPVSREFHELHMAMFRFLSARYPDVRKSLHAGELALGLVPPADLRRHITQAVEIAGADRIGHGVAIAYEAGAPALLARMARDHIAVEINLSSNDVILGIRGEDHPLGLYRAAGVPVVLSTDDLGVSRSDMTQEYMRAAREQDLSYIELKALARASIEYSFLPGESLWAGRQPGERAGACRSVVAPEQAPGEACGALLARSEKARAQWKLENEFAKFEDEIGRVSF